MSDAWAELYPECTKLSGVTGQSQTVGEFLEWLGQQGVQLMRWETGIPRDAVCPEPECLGGRRRVGSRRQDCSTCKGAGYVTRRASAWVSDPRNTQTLLAEFFGIDLAKVESERRAMLEAVRSANT
jgi:hypothetical protein